jgi:hypothetical protein
MKVPTFTLDQEDLAEIGSALGIRAPETLSQLKPRLEEIGARYLLWIQQDEKGPSQAERNDALKRLLASPHDLEPILALLDYACWRCFGPISLPVERSSDWLIRLPAIS